MSKKHTVPKASIILKGLRNRERLTQEDLGKKIQVSKSTISRMENGMKEICSDEAKRLAKALKTKPKMFE